MFLSPISVLTLDLGSGGGWGKSVPGTGSSQPCALGKTLGHMTMKILRWTSSSRSPCPCSSKASLLSTVFKAWWLRGMQSDLFLSQLLEGWACLVPLVHGTYNLRHMHSLLDPSA